MHKIDALQDLIRSHISGETVLERARAYREFPIKLSFSSYVTGIDWLKEQYGQAGLESEVVDFPADGKTIYADRHFLLAWDIEEGWMKAADDDGPDEAKKISPPLDRAPSCVQSTPAGKRGRLRHEEHEREKGKNGKSAPLRPGLSGSVPTEVDLPAYRWKLADYEEDTYGIVPFCGDSNGVQEGVIIPESILREEGMPDGRQDVVVLLQDYGSIPAFDWAMSIGCKAIIAHAGADPSNPTKYNARTWFNAVFGMGQIDARHETVPAFSITSKQADVLMERYRHNGPIPVRYLVRAKAYEGRAPVVTARIAGTEEPNKEFFLSAHAYEPHAANDVAGVAVCLCIANVLSSLIESGELPRPRRSIRFFHGMESVSIYAFAMLKDGLRNCFGGLSFDSLGHKDMNGIQESLTLFPTQNHNPGFVGAVAEKVFKKTAEILGLQSTVQNTFSGNDNLVQDPMITPGWVQFQGTIMLKSGVYHSSTDTCDLLEPKRLAEYVAFGAATAYYMANAGPEEALDIAQMVEASVVARTAKTTALAMESVSEPAEKVRAKARKLLIFKETLAPAISQATDSIGRVIPLGEQDDVQSAMNTLVQRCERYVEGQIDHCVKSLAMAGRFSLIKLKKERMTAIEREAANTFPIRKISGWIGLGTLSEKDRKEACELMGMYPVKETWSFFMPTYYWIDGRRSVLDIAQKNWVSSMWRKNEKPHIRLARIESALKMVRILERVGHLEVRQGPLPQPVHKQDIVSGLKSLGIKRDDVLMVHASLSQFGEVDGGADTVVDALSEVVGSDGILAMPTHTDCQVGGRVAGGYDPKTTPAETGIVAEIFRKRQGVLRSLHPTHSNAAKGSRAREFLSCSDPYDAFDRRGPWGKMLDWKGKILFLGDITGSNTYLHALEAWLLGYLETCLAQVRNGTMVHEVVISNYPGGCREWYGKQRKAAYFQAPAIRELYQRTRIGAAPVFLIDVREITCEMQKAFNEDPELLLHKDGCASCSGRRAKLVNRQEWVTRPAMS